MTKPEFYDELETRDPTARERALFSALPKQIEQAKRNAPAIAHLLQDVNSETVTSRDALAKLPLMRKSQLIELQNATRPFGGLASNAVEFARIFASPGPLFEPEAQRADYWRTARALFAAGFRRGQFVHNAFSYHFTPGGAMFETGAHALGCTVFPAGTGQTEMQIETIARLRPDGYVGTPSFLRIILDRANEKAIDVSSLTKAVVSGEALLPSLRRDLSARGVDVLQCYATADVGLIGYESSANEGLILDEGIITEIVRPGTGDPVPQGEVGEVIVTTLTPEYPLIRLATGDLSAVLPGLSPCGRTNTRLKGWMGRADQAVKVRGLFVHPSQVAQVCKRHPDILKARLLITQEDGNDVITLQCEVEHPQPESLAEAIARSIRDVSQLRSEVSLVAPGTIGKDGKVIDDQRN